MKLTKILKTTIGMFALYLNREFTVQIWVRSETTAVIRLIFFLFILS